MWYIIIALVSSTLLTITLFKTRDKKVVALYTFLSGLTYIFEYIIFVLFNSYIYHPNVLKNAYFDSVLGSVASNAFSIPMTGAMIGALRIGWKGIAFIIFLILLTEKWFLTIHAYEQSWWKISYTGVALIFLFIFAKNWYSKLQGNITVFIRFVSLYFTCILIHASAVYVLVAFFNLYHYRIGWFSNETRDHVAFATAYILFLSLILTPLVAFKMKWVWRVIVIFLTVPINWLLVKQGILIMSDNWSLWHFLILRICILLFLIFFNKVVLSSGMNKKHREN